MIVGMFYFTFIAMMTTNWFLWRHLKKKNLTSPSKKEGCKHLVISVVFAISFLYRALFNNIREYSSLIDDLEKTNIIAWQELPSH